MRRSRRGFVLLAVLWMMAGIAALGLAISVAGRETIATGRNRTMLMGAAWRAEGCLERARAAIAETLSSTAADPRQSRQAWIYLDERVASSPLLTECAGSIALTPAGMALDINDARGSEVARLLRRQGIASARADSMTDALLDWRDVDDEPRAGGAESEWYQRAGRAVPRNGPLAHIHELARVRGFEALGIPEYATDASVLSGLLSVERGRLVLDRAPASVLAALPGLTDETLERIAERRERRETPLVELLALGAELSAASRDSLHFHYADLVGRVTIEPDAWVLSAHAGTRMRDGSESLEAVVELRLVRAGSRAAIVRRRMMP